MNKEYLVSHRNTSILNTVFAENEADACRKVAELKNIQESDLRADMHAIKTVDMNIGAVLTTSAYRAGEEIGINIEFDGFQMPSEMIRVSCGTNNPRMQTSGCYILNWNDEYLDMIILAGPVSEEQACRILRERLIERLLELNIVQTKDEAADLYDKAAEERAGAEEPYELHVSLHGASIHYGGGYEDRYQIVEYNQRLCVQERNK